MINIIFINKLMNIFNVIYERKQKESGSGLALALVLVASWTVQGHAQSALDAGGATFKDFGVADRGASFNRTDPMLPGGPGPASARLLEVDNANGLARVRFEAVKVDLAIPLGWQAQEDPERGVAFNGDRSYRAIVWRLDFAFEGVEDAEHYAATKSGSITARRPTIKAKARKLGDGSFVIAYENVPAAQGDHEPRVVFDLVVPKPGDPKHGVLLTLGVPASQADRGFQLLALLSQNMKIDL